MGGATCPTMKVKLIESGDEIVINAEDYNEELHAKIAPRPALKTKEEKAEAKVDAKTEAKPETKTK